MAERDQQHVKYSDLKKSMLELIQREKALMVEIAELNSDISDHMKQVSVIESEIFEKTKQLSIVRNSRAHLEIDFDRRKISCKGVKVSEHAIIQYLRRVLDVDMSAIVEEMLGNNDIEEQVKTVGDGKYPINSKTTGVVVGGTLVTVFSNNKEKEKSDDRGSKERLLG